MLLLLVVFVCVCVQCCQGEKVNMDFMSSFFAMRFTQSFLTEVTSRVRDVCYRLF